MNMMNADYIYKVLIIGDYGVGKTSLVRRYSEDNFIEENAATLGVEFKTKTIEFGEKTVKLQMWDTAGQERFDAITRTYYNNADGVMMVYDIQNEVSFGRVRHWLGILENYAPENAIKVLVGNKTDLQLDAQRKVTTLEGIVTAYNLGVSFIETSAKTDSNVELAFMTIATEIHERNIPPRPAADNNPNLRINENNVPQGGWKCW